MTALSEVTVKSISKVTLPEGVAVDQPVISPDGKWVVSSAGEYLQRIELKNGKTTRLADADGAFEVRISPDGSQVAWLDASINADKRRMVALKSVGSDGKNLQTIVEPTRKLSTGVGFTGNTVSAVADGALKKRALKGKEAATTDPVASISYGHLNITDANGVTTTIDPQGKGSYLWPQVSPDGTKVVYWCVGQGCFVTDLDGSNPRPLGELRAAVWAGNDLIIGMRDVDDGMVLISSELIASDLDGNHTVLTPADLIALYPSASRKGDRIAFNTAAGELYIMDIKK